MEEKFSKIDIITSSSKFDELKDALNEIGVSGMTVSNVLGCGMQKGHKEFYRGLALDINLLPKIKVEVIVCDIPVELVVETAKKVLHTGKMGDGKIFVYDVKNIIRISNGAEGRDALRYNK
ncbi:P-II family nitrogen regulator [Clostridium estertheticum]|uniref:P-II family nitrogen regulator n=2 Tax=Clostridium TaxID=1485 RepID=A0AA47ENW6_9CLOT|nr:MULTISPECIES: P-II family nitrogen regulator [Clostridium]MBU3100521.1 P-II family nitrogen regulator [Clostridium sp. DSM 17811]MBU3154507.1 P-II family nitrogen regulator [Clostridium estertheticum]MBU3201278.1 P-II family nitrogen regulator [Clostridium estertheticum]MBU3216314.1 P-II family nitrogen regulator [Clostridium estertheticum]MBW9152644.1 P-II family nitrogen regulator [Clostridium estertheticum]